MNNFDRFEQGLPDIQCECHGYCIVCGEGIAEYSQSITGLCGLCQWSADECEEEYDDDQD